MNKEFEKICRMSQKSLKKRKHRKKTMKKKAPRQTSKNRLFKGGK